MQTAMHIGVVVLVVMPERIDDRARLLRRRRVIKIDQRLAVHPFAEDREVLANRIPIEGAARYFVHSLICDAGHDLPLHLRTRQKFRGRQNPPHFWQRKVSREDCVPSSSLATALFK